MDRPRYVREHLGAVADAVAAGVPVRAYFHWSLMDNYEWGTYEPRYGLFGMDRSDPARRCASWTPTPQGDDAAGEFARVVAGPAGRRPLGARADRPDRPLRPVGVGSGRSSARTAPRSPPCPCGGGA